MGQAVPNVVASSLVLVVEDDDDLRATMQEIFEAEGYRVITAGDGRTALDLIDQWERPGVILLDLMMPRMSGGDFLEAARRKHPELARVPVVVVTGHAQKRFALPHISRTMQKPVDLNALLNIVRQVCRPARASGRV